MTMPDIPSDLYTKFNDVTYFDEPHKYFLKGKQLTSVTTLIGRYKPKFDEDYWSEYKASQYNVNKKDILYAWKFINERATTKGSIIHDYTENLFLNKVFPYPLQNIIDKFGYDAVYGQYIKTKEMVDDFYEKTKGKLIPIRTEFIIYDEENMIGGMVDLLVWNIKAQEFQIWDYKTNKAFTYDSEDSMDGKLMFLNTSDIEIYSLQLSTYKYIIEKNTNVKLGKCYLVWFSHLNDTFEIIEAKDRSEYVYHMFEDNKIEMLMQ